MQRLDVHVNALVAVLVASSGEKVQRIIKIEIVMAIKVTSHKVMDTILGDCVQVLELVHRREFDHVQSVGQHAV